MTTDKLSDQCLQSNDNNNAKLISHNKRYEAKTLSSDKRHVVYETDTYHKGHGPHKFYSQGDGNLVIYDSKNQATWSSKTANVRTKRPGPYYCRLFDSGSLKAFDKNNEIMWSSPIDHNLGKL
ncbi:hypothetical protein ACTFIY_005890 [Dictyostelium cf. discoideum]